jgi:hypothetical protein
MIGQAKETTILFLSTSTGPAGAADDQHMTAALNQADFELVGLFGVAAQNAKRLESGRV